MDVSSSMPHAIATRLCVAFVALVERLHHVILRDLGEDRAVLRDGAAGCAWHRWNS